MKIFGLVPESIVDGRGLRFTVFVQGCPHHCPGCHNPGSHDPNGGEEISVNEIVNRMLSNPITTGLTLSGGEPFEQAKDCLTLVRAARESGRNVWAYTGYTYEHLRDNGSPMQKLLLSELDILVDGRFIQEQRSLSLPWRGSCNQRIIDVSKSLLSGTTVEWMEEKRCI